MWTCDVCSFAENSDARTICGLCEAAKPARARQPPQPVGPKWPCSVCTYLNLSSATSCLTCGTPRGATTPAAVPSQPTAPAPAPAARPSASPPTTSTPAGAPTVNEQDVKFLQSMGFVRSRCVAALQVNRDRDNALEWLLNQDAAAAKGSKPSPSPAPAAAPSSSISKPASSAASASRPTATSSASSSSSVSAKPASQPATSSVVQPLKQMSLNDNDKKALEEREAKRLALLKQLDEEAAEKARARAAAAAAVNSTQSVTTAATKKPVAASKQTTSSSSSSSSTSASSSAVSASSPANSKDSDDNLTPEQKRLAKIAAARAADAERRRMAALRVEKRLTAESKLKDIKQVCQALHANYDALRYTAILNLLQRILQNIVNDGGRTEKYLRIPLGPKVDQTLVRPIGPIWILKQAGFEEQVVKEKDDANMEDVDSSHTDEDEEKRVLVMPASKVNLSKIQSVLAALSQQLTAQKSNIPSVFEEMIASGKYSIEQVYYLAIELKMIVQNIIISTDEIDQARTDDDDNRRRLEGVNKNFRTLDKHESFYINRIKPISESKKILAELGFTLDPHDATRQFLVVPMDRLVEDDGVKKYQLIFRELNHILTTLRHRTPIAIELRKLCAQNRQKSMKKLMDILIPAIEAIVKEEHEQKYYKIVLDKVQAKIGTQPHQIIKGLLEFIQLFGFRPATQPDGTIDQHRVTMPYPTDVGLLKLRLDELKENWEELLQQAGAESGQSSTWSFD